MEIKFNQNGCRHLRRAVDQIQTQEQTQEVRLPESMPDIGRVLCCWGKPMIRSKEWRNGGMGVSGGVMAWVLYVPEEGGEPRSIEAWIPFQMKWEFPETQHDGFICVVPCLKGIDARSTSARKLMVRANVALWGQGLEPVETEVWEAAAVPEDVQLLTNLYPMELPCESGEKIMQIDDDVELSGGTTPIEKILRYDFTPVILEQRVMASRAVFRGKGLLHVLYSSDGKLHTLDAEVPFSQFADLDREFGPNATVQVIPVLTNLELDMEEGRLHLKASLAAQYIVCDRQMVNLTEDAYSPRREIQLQKQMLQLPVRLDERTQPLHIQKPINAQAEKIIDTGCQMDCPRRQQNGDDGELVIPGMFQVLYTDPAGNLQCGTVRFEETVQLPADGETAVDAFLIPEDGTAATPGAEQIDAAADVQLYTAAWSRRGQEMVTGLELGELAQPDPMRPSLILRRCRGEGLWALAKESGSTVASIRQANQLEAEPEKGRMLLIPVS